MSTTNASTPKGNDMTTMINDIQLGKFSKFSSYAELRDYGLKCKEGSEIWMEWLRLKQKRDNEIVSLIKETRKKHAGLAEFEIVNMYSSYLNKNFPVYSFQDKEA